MTIRTILTTVHSGIDPAQQLDTGLAIAAKLGSSIDALYVRPNVAAELPFVPDVMALQSIDYAVLDELGRQRAGVARLRFESWRESGYDARRRCIWIEQEGFLEEIVERRGRVADLLVLRHPDHDHPETERAFDAGVFNSGRPCLIVKDTPPKDLFEHVVIAWNGSLQGTHAVAGAMPILRAAAAVTVFNVPEPYGDDRHGLELADALSKHGISAHMAQDPNLEAGVGPALLATASVTKASLIVMGAYTHSRIRQRLLCGVTRHVLSHATMPLLLAH